MTHTPDLGFDVAAVLLDIEGTIASQSFVADVLFPYSAAHLAGFVAAHADDPEVAEILDATRALAGHDGDPVAILRGWIGEDRKAPPLKTIQGLIWESGYRGGVFRGHIWDDARIALEAWNGAGIPLYVYSSGSVFCQRLYFQFSTAGDLGHLFSGHWDTEIGPKIDPESYERIAAAIGGDPARILFFSDNPRELIAAQAAGLAVVHVVREATPPDGRFPEISDFGAVAVRKG
ncbi:acireductone synthase [Siculibacillus lacustris]|uniref:Enolase-phosphatase E1 n=1 Tax=Siculibacillus lacustris TaxID=1549641 RepID=A0A4Q9VYQ6_9HYPH|nr:acireductone synthase [Siculibacillus lacustris]TBW41294.1 acireductone synthase [Siculibacillus lacustris]